VANPVVDTLVDWQNDSSSTDSNLPVAATSIGIGTAGDLTGELRRIKSEIRDLSINMSWERWKGLKNLTGAVNITFTYVSATSFTVNDNFLSANRNVAVLNRRVKAILSTGYIYGRIISASFVAPNTGIGVVWDSGALDATLTEVQFGLELRSSSYPVIMLDNGVQGNFAQISNTATETAFYAPGIFGGQLGTRNKITANLLMRVGLLQGSFMQVRVSYGTLGPVLTIANSSPNTVGLTLCPLTVQLWANGSSTTQILAAQCSIGMTQNNLADPFASLSPFLTDAQPLTQDSSITRVLQINVLFGIASPQNQCDCLGGSLALVQT